MSNKASREHEILARKIGGMLTAVWKESKMTKVELANRAKMGRMSVTKILQGEQLPQLPALYTLCDILKVELSDILPPVHEIVSHEEVKIVLSEKAKAQLPESIIEAIEGRK